MLDTSLFEEALEEAQDLISTKTLQELRRYVSDGPLCQALTWDKISAFQRAALEAAQILLAELDIEANYNFGAAALHVRLVASDEHRCQSHQCPSFGKQLVSVTIYGGIAEDRTYEFGLSCPDQMNVEHVIANGLKRIAADVSFTGESVSVDVVNAGTKHAWSFEWHTT